MKKTHLSLYISLLLVGFLGLTLSGITTSQEIRTRAEVKTLMASNIPADSEQIKKAEPPLVTYTSDKYDYTLEFDPSIWTETQGTQSKKKDLKKLILGLTPQLGRADVTIFAYDENELQNAILKSKQTTGDNLDKVAAYAANQNIAANVSLNKSERIKLNGTDIYRITYMYKTLPFYKYVFLKENKYYEVTEKYILIGKSVELADQLVNSFISLNANTVKGDSDIAGGNLNERDITELSSPSVVHIVSISCPVIKVSVPSVTVQSRGNQSFQYLKESYSFCSGGQGSGFIFSKSGDIATNGHVVKLSKKELFNSEILMGKNADQGMRQFLVDLYRTEELRTREVGWQSDMQWAQSSANNANYFSYDYSTSGIAVPTPSPYITMPTPSIPPVEEVTSEEAEKAMNSYGGWGLLYTITQYMKEGSLRLEDGTNKYFIKLGNEPLPIDPTKNPGKGLFDNVKEAKTIKEANLIDIDFPQDVDALYEDTLTSLFGGKPEIKSGADIAILRIAHPEDNTFPALQLSDLKKINEGDSLLVIGYPGLVMGSASSSSLLNFKSSAKPTITRGVISSIKQDQDGRQLLQTDASIEAGNSGGPAMDTSGKVLGLATYASFSFSGNYNFIRSNAELQKLIDRNNISIKDNPTYTAWQEGLSQYRIGYYRKSIKSFNKVKQLYPIHPVIDKYITDAQDAIKEGKDKEGMLGAINEVIPLGILFTISGIFVLIGATGIFFFIKNRKRIKFNNPINPPSQAPPPLPQVGLPTSNA